MKIVVRRIDHVQICVPMDADEAARKFYLGILGCLEIPKPPGFERFGGFWCTLGPVELHIGLDPVTQRTKGHPALEIEGVAGVRKYLEGLGVRTKDEPDIKGRTRFSFLDPFDNRIEFLEKD